MDARRIYLAWLARASAWGGCGLTISRRFLTIKDFLVIEILEWLETLKSR